MSKDLREELFIKYCKEGWSGNASAVGEEDTKLMLDEYFEKRGKELLEWMAQYEVECSARDAIAIHTGEQMFYYKGKWITVDELFENFL